MKTSLMKVENPVAKEKPSMPFGASWDEILTQIEPLQENAVEEAAWRQAADQQQNQDADLSTRGREFQEQGQ